MSKKSRKYFFGIFEDGPVLKIAQIINSNGHPILTDIKKTEMECSIYHEGSTTDYDNQSSSTPEFLGSEESLEALPELNLDSSEELDSVISPHEHLLSIFPLNQGRLGLNANDEKLSVTYLDRSVRSLARKDLIKLDLLSSEEMRDKDVIWDLVQTAQDQTCVIIHKGENRLFSYLQKYNQIQSEKKYFYSLIDSNDIALINAMRLNYEINKEDDILFLYLGFDYKKGILMKGKELVKSLPILTSSDSYDLEREICSRLALYQDEMEIPHVERVIVSGEYCQDAMLEAVSNTFPSAEVERFKFKDLLFSETIGEELPEEELAAYVIPITTAWKILEAKSHDLIQTNFLEKKIIKSQKLIQFSWHSFLMLAVLLGISYSYTNNILNTQRQLRSLEISHINKKAEYERVKAEKDPGPDIVSQIQELTSSLEKMKSLYKDKSIWSQILENLTVTVRKFPVSWITNIQGNKDGFTIYGKTNKRGNVVKISSAFPNGMIKSVVSSYWENNLIWDFEIRFSYLQALPIVQSWSENKEYNQSENVQKRLKQENTKETRNNIDPVYKNYQLITDLYYSFKHEQLITEAKKFIDKYPDHILTVNCKYLLGEVLWKKSEYQQAEDLLDQVLLIDSPMEPYALYKMAQIYAHTDRPFLAIVNLNLVIKKYPNNDVIPKAENFLKELEAIHE